MQTALSKMDSNIILRRLPESVTVGDIDYPVNWGYRAMILIELCMFDADRSDEQKILDALNNFYNKNIPSDPAEALKQLLWFYRGGRKVLEQTNTGASSRKAKRCYCFQQDAPYIYAAFLSQYGLDLNRTKNYDLHWWKFLAMFESLGEDQKICKIMGYRTASTAGCTKAQRHFLNEMKKLYALDSPDQGMDDKVRLAKRNADMKAYVRRRTMETYDRADGKSEVS